MTINKIENPFVVSKVIPEPLFCDRQEETETLIKQIANGRNTVLMSPRRMGKTGLIHHLFNQPAITDNYYAFFVDIYACNSLQEMCYTMSRVVFEHLKTKRTQHWESFFQILKSLRPGFRIDAISGEPIFDLGLGAIENPTATLEEIFAYLETADKPCIVAFDEFQQIGEFNDKRIEALLRGHIQHCSNTAFLFSGSKQHTISQMFHSKARPFYQSAQMMELAPLDLDIYCDFATRLFEERDKRLGRNVVEQVYNTYAGTTWYLQMMMNELFAITPTGTSCTEDSISTAWSNISKMQEGVYMSQLATLSPRQKGVLQAIAREETVKSIASASFIKKHSLDSASSVQSAIKGLVEKEVVGKGDNGYSVNDFFFGHWLKENY